MEGKLKLAALQGLCLTEQQWREVEQELTTCLKERTITATQYLTAMSEIKLLKRPRVAAAGR